MVVSNFARARRGREERKVEQLRGLAIAFCAMLLVTGCQTARKQAATTEKETASTQPDRLANLAKEIEGRGEQGTALSLYARAAVMPDASASVSVQAGDAYLRSGHVDEAVTAYKAALAKSPNNGSALLGLGSALVDSGDLDAGIRTLTTAAPVVGTSRAYNRLGSRRPWRGRRKARSAPSSKHSRSRQAMSMSYPTWRLQQLCKMTAQRPTRQSSKSTPRARRSFSISATSCWSAAFSDGMTRCAHLLRPV